MNNKKLTKTQLALEILKQTKELTEDLAEIYKLPISQESKLNFLKVQIEGLLEDFRYVAYKLLKLKNKR